MPNKAALFICCALAVVLSTALASRETTTRCGLSSGAHADLASLAPVTAQPEVPTSVASLLKWSVSQSRTRAVAPLALDLTLLLSPTSHANRSTISRYCAQSAAVLMASCRQVPLDCDMDDDRKELRRDYHHRIAHSALARVTDRGDVEVLHLCTSQDTRDTQILRVAFRWDSQSSHLSMRQRTIIGSVRGVLTSATDAPLTAWLVADASALLVSLSGSTPAVVEVPTDLTHNQLTIHSAAALQTELQLPSAAQRISGCWDPHLRVGAVIVGDEQNNTGCTVFALPVTEHLEPLPLLVSYQTAPSSTDTRRCVRHLDNFPLHRCHASATLTMRSNRKDANTAATDIVVEASDHQECVDNGEERQILGFRTEVSLATRNRWSVTPFVEWESSSSGHRPSPMDEKALSLCPPRQVALSDVVTCSQMCARYAGSWWTSPGPLESWSCRVTHYSLVELVTRFILAAMVLVTVTAFVY